MRVTIHTILPIYSTWIEKYINHNTGVQTKGKTFFEKLLHELMDNYCGKTMQNLIDRVNLDFISHTVRHSIFERQSKLSFIGCCVVFFTFSLSLRKPLMSPTTPDIQYGYK